MLWSIVIGLVAGSLARFLMPGKDPVGILVTILLGIGGSLAATFLGKLVGWYQPGEGAGFIGATLGAILVLYLYRKFRKPAAV
ncbi:MAG: GlsB/YeaQ/YmgE family stress response membrane protein [Thermoanaerobaculia bacterium]